MRKSLFLLVLSMHLVAAAATAPSSHIYIAGRGVRSQAGRRPQTGGLEGNYCLLSEARVAIGPRANYRIDLKTLKRVAK